jgi:hypothetical protein
MEFSPVAPTSHGRNAGWFALAGGVSRKEPKAVAPTSHKGRVGYVPRGYRGMRVLGE